MVVNILILIFFDNIFFEELFLLIISFPNYTLFVVMLSIGFILRLIPDLALFSKSIKYMLQVQDIIAYITFCSSRSLTLTLEIGNPIISISEGKCL